MPRGQVEVHETAGEQRLQKVLAAAGLGSRRKCEALILSGRVEVDRQTVVELGTKVDPGTQEVRVDGESLPRRRRVYYAVNKPAGIVCTNYDQSGRPRVIDLLPDSPERLFTVGRLDMSSEGLILVTNDGALADRLTHPRYGVEKTYQVLIAGSLSPSEAAVLTKGVHLAEGVAKAAQVKVRSQKVHSTLLEIVLTEGRNREIRRLLAKVGHKVLRLKRIAIGRVRLADLPVGETRRLRPEELRLLAEDAKPGKRRVRRKPASSASAATTASSVGAASEAGAVATPRRRMQQRERFGAGAKTGLPRPTTKANKRTRVKPGSRPGKAIVTARTEPGRPKSNLNLPRGDRGRRR